MPTYRRDPDDPQIVHVNDEGDHPYSPLPWRSFVAGFVTAAIVLFPLALLFGVVG